MGITQLVERQISNLKVESSSLSTHSYFYKERKMTDVLKEKLIVNDVIKEAVFEGILFHFGGDSNLLPSKVVGPCTWPDLYIANRDVSRNLSGYLRSNFDDKKVRITIEVIDE